MAPTLLKVDNVGKDYAKVEERGGRVRLVFDLLAGRGAARVFRAPCCMSIFRIAPI